jgi:hypothetical protein
MLQKKYKSTGCIVRFAVGEFNHSFGGLPAHSGATPAGCKAPMHLLLSLDMRDPMVPLDSDGGYLTCLPLYYPLRYGCGGGETQYSVDSDTHITVFDGMQELGEDEGLDYPFPESFPSLPVTLRALSYLEMRAIAVSEYGTGNITEDPEKTRDLEILKSIDYWRMIRFGGGFSAIQGDILWLCRNPNCEHQGKPARVEVFASIVGSPTEEISIWGDYGECVEIYFGLMPCCKTITTVNRCT